MLADRRGVGEAIAGRLRDGDPGGSEAVILFADAFDLDDPGAFAGLLESLPAPFGIVHAWSLDAPRFPPPLRPAGLAEARKPGLDVLLSLARALSGPGEPVPCLVLAAGAHEIEGGDAHDPMGAALLGACLALSRERREHPRFAFRGIDLGIDLAQDPAAAARAALVSVEELNRGAEPLVAWRGDRRWLPDLESLPAPADSSWNRPRDRLRKGDHCLVIGGGRLGLLAASILVRRYRARISLIGAKRPAASRLRVLEQAGGEVVAIAVDLGDERGLARAVDRAVARFGDIHAVVLAVEPPPGTVLRPAPEAGSADLDLLFQPAAAGLAALESALAGQAPSVCLAVTPVPSILPAPAADNPGPAVPAIAAADAFAASFIHRSSFPWTAVAWEPGGPSAEAGEALARLLVGDGPTRLALARVPGESVAVFRVPTTPLQVWLPHPSPVDSAVAYPRRLGIHELFEAWAERFPGALAVDSPEGPLTYAELDRRSSRKALCLKRSGVEPETVTAVPWDGSHAMIVGLLGVLKAGGACLVLDPSEPQERREIRARAAGVRLTLGAHERSCSSVRGVRTEGPARPRESDPPAGPSQLAWVHSRSTGIGGSGAEPETVLIEHRTLTNLTFALAQELGLGPDDRVLQLARPGSTAFLRELWMALGTGARLCLVDPRQRVPGPDLEWVLREKEITHLAARTGRLREIFQGLGGGLPALRVICSFEDGWPLPEPWSGPRPGCRLVRLLGPAEVAGGGLIGEIGEDDRSVVLRPMPNLGAWVLPSGISGGVGFGGISGLGGLEGIGELGLGGIGGTGLARGYAGQPGLTADRFVPGPAGAERIFRTGCAARQWPDGALEILPGPPFRPL